MGPVILGLVLFCYWPALTGGKVWDDAAHITKPELQSWTGLGRIWSDIHATQQYYPVLHSAFWIEHRLWGDAVVGYHLVNVLLHAWCCVLLALVLSWLWGSEPNLAGTVVPPQNHDGRVVVPIGAAWVVAVVFAVHPVCVESVAWITEQKNVLSLAFYLSSTYFYLRFEKTRLVRWYLPSAVLFVLAIGTKTVTASLPAALLVVLWWKYGRLRWRRDVVPLLPWFLVAGVAGSITAWVERVLLGANGQAYDLSLVERTLLAGRVIWFYLGKLIWPSNLMFIYPRWDVRLSAENWVIYLVAVLAVTVALWWLRRRSRGPLACWLFFCGSLFPALGFINVYPFTFSYVADHFQYLPSLGLFVGAVAGLALWSARLSPTARYAMLLASGFVVGGLALLSNHQSREYRDSLTLYRVTLEKNPDCWLAHSNLAAELADAPGKLPEALAHYAEALRLKPDNPEIHNSLGNTLVAAGRNDEANAQFGEAVRLDPRFIAARLNLANTLAKDPWRLPAALTHYAEALRQNPESAEAHFSLAVTLAGIEGREAEARAEFGATLRLQPEHAEAWANLAGLLARLPGQAAEAEAAFAQTLRLAPDRARNHYNYAVWLDGQPDREAAAAEHYEAALRINPAYAQAHNNLAVLFARRGRFDQARLHWEAALKASPGYEDASRNLQRLDQRTRR